MGVDKPASREMNHARLADPSTTVALAIGGARLGAPAS
jgi:hypothetical protein